MSDNSKIEWTDATWNPVTGCTKVSQGCKHCYAERVTKRFGGDFSKVQLHPDRLAKPLHWKKPRMIFVNSMSDLFHESVPFDFVDQVFAVMALCPQHTFQQLTKRPERMAAYLWDARKQLGRQSEIRRAIQAAAVGVTELEILQARNRVSGWSGTSPGMCWKPLPNVWLGTSVENQETADARIPWLLRCPAAVRFLSAEPLLGPVDLKKFLGPWVSSIDYHQCCPRSEPGGIGLVICGGESGPGARPCYLSWIESIRDQCQSSNVPCFIKQLGSMPLADQLGKHARGVWVQTKNGIANVKVAQLHLKDHKGGDPAEWPEDLRVREMPERVTPNYVDPRP